MRAFCSILRCSAIFRLTACKDLGNSFTSRGVKTWRILAQVITGDLPASRSVHYTVHIAHVLTGVWYGDVGCPFVYCLCLARQILFSTRAPVESLTTANQRRAYIRIVSPSSMWRTLATESWFSFSQNGWVNPESDCTTEILISALGEIRIHNLLTDSPACCHWAITALYVWLNMIHFDRFNCISLYISW